MIYIVEVQEVWVQPVEVEAESKEEAIRKVQDSQGSIVEHDLQYSHCLDSKYWSVYEIQS